LYQFDLERCIASPLRGETPTLTAFSNSTFCDGATYRRRNKVEQRYTTTNLSLSTDIKTISELKRLNGNMVIINFTVQSVTDKQKTSTYFAPSGGIENPHPPYSPKRPLNVPTSKSPICCILAKNIQNCIEY